MNFKKISMIMFVTWTVMLILILTFGTKVASMISSNVSKEIYEEKSKLKDVFLEDTKFQIEYETYLSIKTIPDTHDLNDLVYTSLTPDIFTVEKNKVIGTRFNNDSNTGILLVTSLSNPEFKKEIELTFTKTYPESYKIYFNGNEINKEQTNFVYLQKPLTINCELDPNPKYITEKNIEYVYDEELFELISFREQQIHLVPKYQDFQIGDSFDDVSSSILVYLNEELVETVDIVLKPTKYLEQFDKVYLQTDSNKTIEMGEDVFVLEEYFINFSEEPENVFTYFEVFSDNEEIAEILEGGKIKFKQTGNVNIKVRLNNGFSKTYNVKVRNKILKPYIECSNLGENNIITIKQQTKTRIIMNFPDDASVTDYTYSYDESMVKLDCLEDNELLIYGSKIGTTDVVITISDGIEEPLIVIFKINVVKNENSFSTIIAEFSRFLAKVLGHMSFFVLQGILAFFMMCYHKSSVKWLNTAIIVIIGTSTAWLTEFIQLFMKGRNCSIQDVFIDLGGYLIGLIIAVSIHQLITLYKRHHKKVKL